MERKNEKCRKGEGKGIFILFLDRKKKRNFLFYIQIARLIGIKTIDTTKQEQKYKETTRTKPKEKAAQLRRRTQLSARGDGWRIATRSSSRRNIST